MTVTSDLKNSILADLARAKKRLEYSYKKVLSMNIDQILEEDDEALEVLESFSGRFGRFSDILLNKYFRLLAKERDPAFKGSAIDLINLAEKEGWIESATTWTRIRQLRNLAVYEYEAQDYQDFYKELGEPLLSFNFARSDFVVVRQLVKSRVEHPSAQFAPIGPLSISSNSSSQRGSLSYDYSSLWQK